MSAASARVASGAFLRVASGSSPLVLLSLLTSLGHARAANVEEEHESVQQRLADERTALDALKGQKEGLLDVLDQIERISRTSSAQVASLEQRVTAFNDELERTRAHDERAQAALSTQLVRLRPRLVLMYRLSRRDRVGRLLTASDFASLMKRSRAMTTLVREDVALLEDTRLIARYQQRCALRLESARASAARMVGALRREAELSKVRRAVFQELVASVQSEASQSGRVIRDLEAAEAQLASMVSEMKTALPSSGLRSMKGRLPYPVHGLLEVGFGKVVNPRFNTVTVQKGIDFRARAGTPVVAIAPGTVAFAGWLKGYGNLVIVDHGGGYHTLLAHLSQMDVEPGNEVERGEELGAVGDTGSLKGPFLYFEIRHQGQAIDPAPWLDEDVEP